jgi:hypothetical protein
LLIRGWWEDTLLFCFLGRRGYDYDAMPCDGAPLFSFHPHGPLSAASYVRPAFVFGRLPVDWQCALVLTTADEATNNDRCTS